MLRAGSAIIWTIILGSLKSFRHRAAMIVADDPCEFTRGERPVAGLTHSGPKSRNICLTSLFVKA